MFARRTTSTSNPWREAASRASSGLHTWSCSSCPHSSARRAPPLGTVIGETTLAASYLVALRVSERDVLPGLGRAARALAAAGPCFAILLVPGLPSWLAALLALALYGGLLVVTRAVPDELIEVLPLRRP
jgi:hypothetical protein